MFACGKLGDHNIELLTSNSALEKKVWALLLEKGFFSSKIEAEKSVRKWTLLSNRGDPFSCLVISNSEKEVIGAVPMEEDESGELFVDRVGNEAVTAAALHWLVSAYLPLLQKRGMGAVRVPAANLQWDPLPPSDSIFLWTPICAESKLGRAHSIKTITTDDALETEVAQFLGSEEALPLFGEERRYSPAEAKEIVSEWRKCLNEGNPFSCLAILDNAKKIVGLIWMDVRSESLHVTGMGKKDQMNEIVFQALSWLTRAYLPPLQESERNWPDLYEIRASASPRSREFFSRAGFTRTGRIFTQPLFQWQSPRSVYEVARLLYNSCVALIEEILAGNFCPWRGRSRDVYEMRLGFS